LGAYDIGFDLGTSNTVIFNKNKGILLNEPSVIAMESYTNKLVAVGEDARQMLGRTPDTVTAVRPLADGVIENFERAAIMVSAFVKRVKPAWGSMRAVVTVPYMSSAVERRAVEDAILSSKIKKVHLIEGALAAAIGLNLPIFEPKGYMIVDIGGGKTEISVVSLGGIVAQTTSDICGTTLDRDIVSYVRKTYSILIGECVAEEIKLKIGSALEREELEFMTVSGRDLVDGLPLNLNISSDEVNFAMKDSLYELIDSIKATFERVDPELTADIIQNGITLVGGGALLPGIADLIYSETGVATQVAADPTECIAIGTGRAVDMLDKLKSTSSIE